MCGVCVSQLTLCLTSGTSSAHFAGCKCDTMIHCFPMAPVGQMKTLLSLSFCVSLMCVENSVIDRQNKTFNLHPSLASLYVGVRSDARVLRHLCVGLCSLCACVCVCVLLMLHLCMCVPSPVCVCAYVGAQQYCYN